MSRASGGPSSASAASQDAEEGNDNVWDDAGPAAAKLAARSAAAAAEEAEAAAQPVVKGSAEVAAVRAVLRHAKETVSGVPLICTHPYVTVFRLQLEMDAVTETQIAGLLKELQPSVGAKLSRARLQVLSFYNAMAYVFHFSYVQILLKHLDGDNKIMYHSGIAHVF